MTPNALFWSKKKNDQTKRGPKDTNHHQYWDDKRMNHQVDWRSEKMFVLSEVGEKTK